jgi:hypothetical protein
MPDTELEPPFQAYSGDGPFIFVSYSHKDAAAVFPELQELRDLGYRIWFDEGIDPGNEWPEEIANALNRAAMFLVFISSAAVASQNVRNEIYLALKLNKDFLAVHLSETELPKGLQLSISSLQAVLKHRMSSEGYRRKIKKALPDTLREAQTVSQPPARRSVYLSYHGHDVNVAQAIVDGLKGREINVFFDYNHLLADAFQEQISGVFKQSESIVVLLSLESVQALHDEGSLQRKEIEMTRSMNKRLLPVLVGDHNSSTLLQHLPPQLAEVEFFHIIRRDDSGKRLEPFLARLAKVVS